jgi:mycothiol synthase
VKGDLTRFTVGDTLNRMSRVEPDVARFSRTTAHLSTPAHRLWVTADAAAVVLRARRGRCRLAPGERGGLLLFQEGELVGFHWTEVHAAEQLGEVYILGVRPGTQGGGLGKALTTIGLRHLAAQDLPTAMLYVDADNKAAVSVYERLGFTTYETDLMYRTET